MRAQSLSTCLTTATGSRDGDRRGLRRRLMLYPAIALRRLEFKAYRPQSRAFFGRWNERVSPAREDIFRDLSDVAFRGDRWRRIACHSVLLDR